MTTAFIKVIVTNIALLSGMDALLLWSNMRNTLRKN